MANSSSNYYSCLADISDENDVNSNLNRHLESPEPRVVLPPRTKPPFLFTPPQIGQVTFADPPTVKSSPKSPSPTKPIISGLQSETSPPPASQGQPSPTCHIPKDLGTENTALTFPTKGSHVKNLQNRIAELKYRKNYTAAGDTQYPLAPSPSNPEPKTPPSPAHVSGHGRLFIAPGDMTTSLGSSPAPDPRRTMASPRPKGRENARNNTTCRNIGIYGYCRYEHDGCMYNHEVGPKPGANSSQRSVDAAKNRFNVDSPSFTPLQAQANGFQSRPSVISPKSANAAPFTPKSNKQAQVYSAPAKSAPDWTTTTDFPEFVPQAYEPEQMMPHDQSQTSSHLYGHYDPFSHTPGVQSLSTTPQPPSLNPYMPEAQNLANAAGFFPNTTGFAQPLQYHLYAGPTTHRENLLPYQRTAHDFFMPEKIREELQRKAEASLQILPNSTLPPNVDHFHTLVPLDTSSQKTATLFGYPAWVYKAMSSKDGRLYALRRLEGYRLTNEHAIRSFAQWKQVYNGNIVTGYDSFTTRAFGDSSLIFVSDYHPASKTLAEHHFPNIMSGSRFRQAPSSTQVPESVLWTYIVQITNALKAIHARGLAAQVIHPSKILVTSKNRLRLNGCGILDVVRYNPAQLPSIDELQRKDFIDLGHVILLIASGNPSALLSPQKSLDALARSGYQEPLRDCITWLLDPPQQGAGQPHIVDVFLPAIASHVMDALDTDFHATDSLTSTLSAELENGRVARLLCKMNMVLERSELEHNALWAETGERYYIKLFRDYVFHAVDASGAPNVDLGHILGCLNRLDAGTEERIVLTSRDAANVFVVSFREMKRAVESAWGELVSNATSGAQGKARK